MHPCWHPRSLPPAPAHPWRPALAARRLCRPCRRHPLLCVLLPLAAVWPDPFGEPRCCFAAAPGCPAYPVGHAVHAQPGQAHFSSHVPRSSPARVPGAARQGSLLTKCMHVLPPSQIATSPVLVLVGIIIFASAVIDINWEDYSEAVPVLVTTTIMPFTSNVSGATTAIPNCHSPGTLVPPLTQPPSPSAADCLRHHCRHRLLHGLQVLYLPAAGL